MVVLAQVYRQVREFDGERSLQAEGRRDRGIQTDCHIEGVLDGAAHKRWVVADVDGFEGFFQVSLDAEDGRFFGGQLLEYLRVEEGDEIEGVRECEENEGQTLQNDWRAFARAHEDLQRDDVAEKADDNLGGADDDVD